MRAYGPSARLLEMRQRYDPVVPLHQTVDSTDEAAADSWCAIVRTAGSATSINDASDLAARVPHAGWGHSTRIGVVMRNPELEHLRRCEILERRQAVRTDGHRHEAHIRNAERYARRIGAIEGFGDR